MIAFSVANNLRCQWSLVDHKNDTMMALQEVLPIGEVYFYFLVVGFGPI